MPKSLFDMEERDEHRDLVIAGLPVWSPLRKQMLRCGREDYWRGNTYYCRTVACPRCRAREIRAHKRRLKRRYLSAKNGDLLSLTVCFEPVASLEEVTELWVRVRKQITYLFTKCRKRSRRWNTADLSATLEVLPFSVDEIPLMGSDQQQMLASMGTPCPNEEGGPLWLAHIHAIVHATDLDWQEVRDTFAEKWSHPFQVHAEPFYGSKPKDDNIDALAFYGLKYEPGRMLMNGRFVWPLAWMREYYSWAHSFSRSYQSFKFSVGRKKTLSAFDTLQSVGDRLINDKISSFPILYTDGSTQAHVVDLPLDHADPASAWTRWELVDWCRTECHSGWCEEWLTARDIARFHFADLVEAVAFKLRFSDLLSQSP